MQHSSRNKGWETKIQTNFFTKQSWVVKKISETKDREYIRKLLSPTLEASPDTAGDKLPRICSIPSNIAPVEKPDKEETIENMKI